MKKNLLALGLITTGLFASAQTTRTVLFEEFTGENCAPCAATNPGVDATLAANAANVIALKWQVPIPSAPSNTWSLYRTNQAEIDWRYRSTGYNYPSQNTPTSSITNGINSAPSGRLDGRHQWEFGMTSDHPYYLSTSGINNAKAQTTPFSITMNTTWDATFSNCVVEVTVQATSAFTPTGTLMYRLCLVERKVEFATAPGTNGEQVFHDVVRKSYPTTTSGTVVTGMGTQLPSSWTASQVETFTINCAIPSYIVDKSQMSFVGFIQDDGTKMVWQAGRTPQPSIPNDIKLNTIASSSPINCTGITPTITVTNQGPNAITDLTITPYVNGVAQTNVLWTGSLASAASTVIALNSYTAAHGASTFSVNIAGVSGGDVNVNNNYGRARFGVSSSTVALPLTQAFATFPPANWYVLNPNFGAQSWGLGSAGGFGTSSTSAKYDFYNNGVVGDADDLVFPSLNLTGIGAPNLVFDVAYAQYSAGTSGENDQLDVFVSIDCGATWTNVYSKAGANLMTANNTTSAFVPTASQWRTEAISLPTAANQPNVIVKFVATSDYGNNLYVDNVNLGQSVSVAKHAENMVSFDVYPNPATNAVTIKAYSALGQNGEVFVYNTLGQIVHKMNVNLQFGMNEIAVNTSELTSGVYHVVLNTDKGSMTKKLTVSK